MTVPGNHGSQRQRRTGVDRSSWWAQLPDRAPFIPEYANGQPPPLPAHCPGVLLGPRYRLLRDHALGFLPGCSDGTWRGPAAWSANPLPLIDDRGSSRVRNRRRPGLAPKPRHPEAELDQTRVKRPVGPLMWASSGGPVQPETAGPAQAGPRRR